ncbi:MAG: hypothetical protein KIT18_03230 [Burkholderiales bacterium]|nr:hypothetical protein [Burkholderiales bacterium]
MRKAGGFLILLAATLLPVHADTTDIAGGQPQQSVPAAALPETLRLYWNLHHAGDGLHYRRIYMGRQDAEPPRSGPVR